MISGMAGSIGRARLLPPESVTCGFDLCKRFAHCRRVSRPFIKIVVTCVDAALEDQVRDRGAERRAAPCWHDGVALRYDERRRHEGGSNELNGRHAMAEKKADRSPPVEIPMRRGEFLLIVRSFPVKARQGAFPCEPYRSAIWF